MLSQFAYIFCSFLLIITLGGCANLNCTRLEGLLGGKTDLVDLSYKIAEDLTESALPPILPGNPNMPVLVTTFVSNSDLEKTSSFGRLLQEHVASRFVQLGFTVKELKLAKNLYIEPQSGETILTREFDQLSSHASAQAIVVGTFTRTNRTLYLSSRIINPETKTIISSKDYTICMDDDILAMFGLQRPEDGANSIEEPSQPLLNNIL